MTSTVAPRLYCTLCHWLDVIYHGCRHPWPPDWPPEFSTRAEADEHARSHFRHDGDCCCPKCLAWREGRRFHRAV